MVGRVIVMGVVEREVRAFGRGGEMSGSESLSELGGFLGMCKF